MHEYIGKVSRTPHDSRLSVSVNGPPYDIDHESHHLGSISEMAIPKFTHEGKRFWMRQIALLDVNQFLAATWSLIISDSRFWW